MLSILKWLGHWARSAHRWQKQPTKARFRPTLESLEDRVVLTVRYYGGVVLANVGVEAVFLGANWGSDPALIREKGQIEDFLRYLTNSSYLDMLTQAGYGVGRGTFLDSWIDPQMPVGRVNDAQIQNEISSGILSGQLQAPDANRLYFVFVEPGLDVINSEGKDSNSSFYGYHSDYGGPTGAAVNYAVIPFPDGALNGTYPHLSSFETLTEVSSHELAESVTDPQGDNNVGSLAWYDYTYFNPRTGNVGGEIADLADGEFADLGGYVVQGVANRRDQPMIPDGSTPDPRFPDLRPHRRRRHQSRRHVTGARPRLSATAQHKAQHHVHH